MPESRAIEKMCGIETEFGCITHRANNIMTGAQFFLDLDPRWFSTPKKVKWDARDRLSARFVSLTDEEHHSDFANDEWLERANHLLENGGRFYRDLDHPEYSTPLCRDPRMAVTWNRAGYRRIHALCRQMKSVGGRTYRFFRNNVARGESGSRVSFACHVNITGDRTTPLDQYILASLAFFPISMPIWGSGKVGCDTEPGVADFQISQRADFTTEVIGGSTVSNRPIYNLRDVPYGDRSKFRRIHIIVFDSNMLELPEYLKVGLTSILYMMVEDSVFDAARFELYDPLSALHRISWDTDLNTSVRLINQKKTRMVLDLLQDYADTFWGYLEAYHPTNEILKDVVVRFQGVLDKLRARDFPELFGKLDWVTKKLLIENALDRKRKDWNDFLAYDLDLRYHENDHESGLFYTKIDTHPECERVTNAETIAHAEYKPPPTRSKWIAEITNKYGDSIAASNYWNRLVFVSKDKSPPIYTALNLDDICIQWDETIAGELLSLPLEQFLEEAERRGIASASPDKPELRPTKSTGIELTGYSSPIERMIRKQYSRLCPACRLRESTPQFIEVRRRTQLEIVTDDEDDGKELYTPPHTAPENTDIFFVEPDDLYLRSLGELIKEPPKKPESET